MSCAVVAISTYSSNSTHFYASLKTQYERDRARMLIVDAMSCNATLSAYGSPAVCKGFIDLKDASGNVLVRATGTTIGGWTVAAYCNNATGLDIRVAKPKTTLPLNFALAASNFRKDPLTQVPAAWSASTANLFPGGAPCQNAFLALPVHQVSQDVSPGMYPNVNYTWGYELQTPFVPTKASCFTAQIGANNTWALVSCHNINAITFTNHSVIFHGTSAMGGALGPGAARVTLYALDQ